MNRTTGARGPKTARRRAASLAWRRSYSARAEAPPRPGPNGSFPACAIVTLLRSRVRRTGDVTAGKRRATLGPVSTRRTLLLLAVLATGVVTAGCTGSGPPQAQVQAHAPQAHGAPATTSSTTTTSTTEPPVSPMAWSPCNGDLQCGTLVVPLDYAHPDGPTISVAVARHLAEEPDARIGSLVIDPGGPGVSGINDMSNELSALTPQLLEDFDIVLFDPRGVERSDPVTCGSASGSGPSDPTPVTPSQQAQTIAELKQFAAACETNSASVLPYVGTVDVARDMDRLRQALGDGGLTYMGQSYGTLLGLTYAALFPTHIRAMVLDSVIDPALSFDQITMGQADGFEGVLNAFFTWCTANPDCAWHPAGDPTTALLALLNTAATAPAPAGGGSVVGAGQLYDALLEDLYSQTDWPRLGQALADDAAGNGAPAAAQSNQYNTGGSDNADDAATAIDCVDHPVSRDWRRRWRRTARWPTRSRGPPLCSARFWPGARPAAPSGPCRRHGPSGRWRLPVRRPFW